MRCVGGGGTARAGEPRPGQPLQRRRRRTERAVPGAYLGSPRSSVEWRPPTHQAAMEEPGWSGGR
eukprot:12582165-Alexandrium_andersonii.AAC.1